MTRGIIPGDPAPAIGASPRHRVVTASLLLGLLLAGCANQQPSLTTIERVDRTLEPGAFVEVDLEKNESARVEAA